MEESPDKVYARHRGLIRSLINSIVVNNPSVVDTQDLQQAGALAFIVALRSYDPSLGSFSSYIRKCVRHALLEQANSFNAVFTVDEKVRRQANAIRRMRREGMSDADIMTQLGIKKEETFQALSELGSNHTVDMDNIEPAAGSSGVDENRIHEMLDEIGLSESEMRFVHLTIDNRSMDDIAQEMRTSRTALYVMRSSIHDKILAWGQDD